MFGRLPRLPWSGRSPIGSRSPLFSDGPLGLPIPHTAIVPKSKDRIGEGLATFIEHNFLTPELIKAKLRSIDIAWLVANWLSCPANADAVADRLIRTMPHLIDAIDDRDAREYLGDTLGRQLGTIDLARYPGGQSLS